MKPQKTEKNLPPPSPSLPELGKITPQSIVKEVQDSYLDYAMSVIISRALPDVRDGLKPVHRRILYAMWDMGLKPQAKFRKSATVVGEVLGKYHPHGDIAVYDTLVRLAQDFSLRYPLVFGQGNFGCFTKDTKVKLTDGRDLTFGELVEEYKQGKKNYTYTVNNLGLISIAEIKRPRLTIKNAELVKIKLDNGAEIRCTPNHRFMLLNGSYKEAKDLNAGESLMPIYQKLSTKQDRLNREGYILIYQNKTEEWVPAHHLADNFNLSDGKYKKNAGRVRHHINFNKLNNNPDNIIRMQWKEHWQKHYENASLLHQKEDYRTKIAEGRKNFWSDLENKQRYSERLSLRNIKNWQIPEYKEKMRRFLSEINKEYIKNHPEKRAELSERATKTLKKLWRKPKYRKLFHEKIVASNKRRVTNSTGKLKFLNICRSVVNSCQILNKELYEEKRNAIYNYGKATTWKMGLQKYFDNDVNLVLHELNKNHKVVKVEHLSEYEDVYDLTIDKSHNFALADGVFVHNSLDGDSAAAMRYTECKLAHLSEEVLTDIERETVNFVPNYDGVHQEPTVLPAKLPNLLLNGTMGIAVGMATNIPPHNLGEVCDAVTHLLENPEADAEDLAEFVKGPDFPTGAIIYDKKEITQAYATGRGRIVTRAKTEIVETKAGSFQIIVSEIPYQVNKAALVEKIAELVHAKKIEGIKDLRDESNKNGVRVVIELKKDSYPKKVLNQLFNLTQLQETFHLNMLALVDGIQPRVLNLKNILEEYVKHRQIVVRRRAEFDLKKAQERAHILKGLKIALDNIDAVIKTIKQSRDKDEAKINLIKKFKLSEAQAVAILEMKLQQLANLEQRKIEDELKEKLALIKELEAILASPKRIRQIIKSETEDLKKKYGDERRTQVVPHGVKEFSMEDLVPNEDTVVMITRDGYLKRLPPETFRTQGRGGKGVIGVTTKEEDVVEHLFSTTTHSDLLFFTTGGRVFQLKAYDVPAGSRTSKGQSIVNFLQLSPAEKISAVLSLADLGDYRYLVMVTRGGVTKKVDVKDFANVRRSGLIALKLKGDDLLKWVKPSTGQDEIMLITAQGQSIRFKEKNIRAMGRAAAGVRGMRLKGKDFIVGMDIIDPAMAKSFQLFVIAEEGLGKRTPVPQYRLQGRGGSGIKTAKITAKTGKLIGAYVVNAKDERDLMIISTKGQIIRLPFGAVPVIGRSTQGVRLMRFKEPNDKVASVTLV